jgi:hypothetical protein
MEESGTLQSGGFLLGFTFGSHSHSSKPCVSAHFKSGGAPYVCFVWANGGVIYTSLPTLQGGFQDLAWCVELARYEFYYTSEFVCAIRMLEW